jgi:hypothetical protein
MPPYSDGMFAILVPAALLPLIATLLWAENKAKKLGIIMRAKNGELAEEQLTIFEKIKLTAAKLDVMGLLLIGTSVALILLPLTLSQSAKGGWNNGTLYTHNL